ncbi:MAG TPA: glycosyltransferase family 9 protein [Pyrinomonadaceae bacterium]|jgi:predicted lipopolysaccharide heptosyltransferase III|nr:glycosyltransferase family 9 protein [Pyrinomonadaceae bacterium]
MKSLHQQLERDASSFAASPALTPETAGDESSDELSDDTRAASSLSSPSSSSPQPLAAARWDWSGVRRVLVVRLRSIGDTVLATPALYALRRFLPRARIDVLLEDWVAPVLEGSEDVDRIVTVGRESLRARVRVARELRASRYDVAFNLHGGSTATFLTRASGATHRVGYASYRYGFLHTALAPPSSALWQREKTHSVEQQLALLGWTGVPVSDRPETRLAVTTQAAASVARRLQAAGVGENQSFALMHPAAAFASKTWATENFARVAEELAARQLLTVATAAPDEAAVVARLASEARARVVALTDLKLPEVTALAARARLFVGNDSGIAHIAAAVGVPSVVIFGSSNVAHWRPWSRRAPSEVVRASEMACAPCPGDTCTEFDAPECIRRVSVAQVAAAVGRVLERATDDRLLPDGGR